MSFVQRMVLVPVVAAALPFTAAAQSAYPAKPIRMIIPLAAASAVDNAARIVAQRMSINMGEQIVVDNQPGAAGLIGAEPVARAVPDGNYHRRLQRQHHDHAAEPARENAVGYPEGL